MPLAVGDKLGPYEILAPIGEGGMGQVWKATDTRLNRSVAIKICHVHFTERFESEARTVAALNHPNICTLHDVGPDYLVMELVGGPTLAERIAAGPLPLDEALAIARQIAEALEAAHEKGIIHRDLKPANVKLTANGNVKVLDFGLAKILDSGIAANANPNSSPTLTLSATRAGVILGTVAYMSPEQARGIQADKRADIWAFGVVLYEMLTGKQMFASDTVSDTLAYVLKNDPDWSALPAATPAPIRRVLRRCLQRDRKRRLHDIADARLEIDEALSGSTEAPAAVPTLSRSRVSTVVPWALAALLLVSIAWLALLLSRSAPPDPFSFQVLLPPPEKAAFTPVQTNMGGMAVSPDGTALAFVATQEGRTSLWVRRLDSVNARPLLKTENAAFPFWSPDNRFLGFFADGKLKKIDLDGGSPHVICAANGLGRGGTWNRDGVIVFGARVLQRVSAAGGQPIQIRKADKGQVPVWPSFLPDGRHFLYVSRGMSLRSGSIRVGSLDSNTEVDHDVELLKANSSVLYVPSVASGAGSRGWVLFQRDSTVFAQRFNPRSLHMESEATAIADGVRQMSSIGFANFSVSENGVLVYGGETGQTSHFVWMGRDGRSTPVKSEPAAYFMPGLSPDGTKLAVSIAAAETGNMDVWQVDLVRGTPTRLTFDADASTFPLWSPDGKKIAFAKDMKIHLRASNGSGNEERIDPSSEGDGLGTDWSRDGRYLAITRLGDSTGPDLWILDLQQRKSRPLLITPFSEGQAQFSPDGRWVAYSSDATGRFEIYVRSFMGAAQFLVSNGGGAQARWRGDGKELYYATPDGKMMAVNVQAGAESFQFDAARVLFESRALLGVTGTGPQGHVYDVTRDGQRFLVIERGDAGSQPLTLVTNWQAGLKR